MGSLLPQLRASGAAGLCTVALFAIAAWLPNDVIDFVAWLMAMFLGLPVSVLARIYAVRSAAPVRRPVPAGFTLAVRIFGALSLLLGIAILGWQAYNGFVRRLPEFTGLTAIAQALLTAALIGFGSRLLSRPWQAGNIDRDAA